MVVRKVVVSPAVYRCCIEHALSTEKEEVMGLLIGQLENSDEAECEGNGDVIRFEATKIIRRQDKRPDRVEIPVEQLVFGVQRAEAIEKVCNEAGISGDVEKSDSKKLRILGWYHSHPHITVWPSHVDLATQNNYQTMDRNFVGLIFSVFNDDNASKASNFELTCFQTRRGADGDLSRISIPVEIGQSSSLLGVATESASLRKLIESERLELPATLHEEEIEAYKIATNQHSMDDSQIAALIEDTDALNGQGHVSTADQLASVKNDLALKLGHTRLFEYVSIPLLEQKQLELEMKRRRLEELNKEITRLKGEAGLN